MDSKTKTLDRRKREVLTRELRLFGWLSVFVFSSSILHHWFQWVGFVESIVDWHYLLPWDVGKRRPCTQTRANFGHSHLRQVLRHIQHKASKSYEYLPRCRRCCAVWFNPISREPQEPGVHGGDTGRNWSSSLAFVTESTRSVLMESK